MTWFMLGDGILRTRHEIEEALPWLRVARDSLLAMQAPEGIALAGLIVELEVLRNAPMTEEVT